MTSFRLIINLVLLTLTLLPLCRADGEPWVGSKLGTEKYHKEYDAIELAKADYVQAIEEQSKTPRKELLCVTFLKATIPVPTTLLENVNIMGSGCDWAIVMYDGEQQEVNAICNHSDIAPKVVLCERNADTFHEPKTSVPKTVLYQGLLPVLPRYHRVFLMDEDISLSGFNHSQLLTIWNCAFEQRPLIVQPLVVESNQYLVYVNERPWLEAPWTDVIASQVGYIEQQVPMFDSIFFTWFVKRVLSQTKEFSLKYGIDWGHDRSWCNAAKMYARDVLHWPVVSNESGIRETAPPCALVTQRGTGVHHLNKMTMKIIRGNAAVFRKHAFIVVQKYVDLFPTWVGMDMLNPNNPLDPANAKKFKQVRNGEAAQNANYTTCASAMGKRP
mmetsp:Transcript_7988/g.13276  ORF Transcript_7988/g.13276 Transcript_7988/m.13276 type:complete len:386 (+) Transcript_7988:142-1299(+)